nr:hypothetical protein [Candidatus Saccharibacteria bacterium]NIV04103.1 hypothetical protein [Calditrichia bacterium]NIV72815.1 hypothetical protein [Calditrichia bacterium]NIW00207.1 hypothetical protein [Candidatus Saccharibacteria bacterium]NIW79665.1 hypothetical protein [Calditrichia bacterium]
NLKVGNTDQLVSIIQVMDLARGIMLAAEHPKSTDEIFFIANEQPAAWSEVINILQKLMNKKVKNISIPYSVAYLFGGVMEGIAYLQKKPTILNRQKIREVNSPYWVVSTQKIQEYLNYSTQLTLEDGLSKTLTWYLEQGWLKN